MRIRPFAYHRAETLAQALELLETQGPEVKVLAGGTDLVLGLKEKRLKPTGIVDIQPVKELEYIRQEGSQEGLRIHIGALTRHADLAASPLIREQAPVLAQAAGLIGSVQIRNLGTLGGNLANGSPAADSAPPLLALDARVVLAGPKAEEELPLRSFFLGPGETRLKPGLLLKEVVLDLPQGRGEGRYLKLMRKKAVDLALVGVAFQAELDPSGQGLARAAIALGGVAPTPIRAAEAEERLLGLGKEEALAALPGAARAAAAATRPISDLRASADYRRAMVEAFVRRGGREIINRLFR